jgi:hypothetical protein
MTQEKSFPRLVAELEFHLLGMEWAFIGVALGTLLWAAPLVLYWTTWGHTLGIAWAVLYGLILLMTTPAHVGILMDAVRTATRRPPRFIPLLERSEAKLAEARAAVPIWARWVMESVPYANPLCVTSLLSMTYIRIHEKETQKAETTSLDEHLGHRTAVTVYYVVNRREREMETEAMTSSGGVFVG